MRFALKALLLAGCLLPATLAGASSDERPQVIVRPAAVVKGAKILLGDIATISATEPEFQKLVTDLKAIDLGEAPPPKTKTGIPGAKILSMIEAKGIQAQTIAYSIPLIVQVERAGRVLAKEEVLGDIREVLSRDERLDVQVREVLWDAAQVVPMGATSFEVERLGDPSSGKIPLRIIAKVDEIPAARFTATAVVDDWRAVPVLKRTLERGMLISPEDVELVRLNMFKQPQDVADSLDDVLGRAAKSRMNAGETLRKSMVDIPPLVPQGKAVTLIYKSGALRATASGAALDNGLRGDVIRVRNESSKKVVRAKVLNESELEVESQ